MKCYDVYISAKDIHYNLILETNEPIKTLELWARTMVNKYCPDFEITDVDYFKMSFFCFNDDFQYIHVMFTEREGYRV